MRVLLGMGREWEEREEQRAELERQFPGWQIFCHGDKWSAQVAPRGISAGSPEELAGLIRAAHADPTLGFAALASLEDYEARLIALRAHHAAMAAAWRRAKAKPRGRRAAWIEPPEIA
jgi:hypothetical protein